MSLCNKVMDEQTDSVIPTERLLRWLNNFIISHIGNYFILVVSGPVSAEKWIDRIDCLNMGIYSLLVILLSYKIQGESSKQTKLLVLFGNVPQRGINGHSQWVVHLTAAPLRLNSQTI